MALAASVAAIAVVVAVAAFAVVAATVVAFVALVAVAPPSGTADRVRGRGFYPNCQARAAGAAVIAAVWYRAAITAAAVVAAIVAAASAVVAAIAVINVIRAKRNGQPLARATATVVAAALAAAVINASNDRVRGRRTRPCRGARQPRQVALSSVGLGVCVCHDVSRIGNFPRCPWARTRRDAHGDCHHSDSSLPTVRGFIPQVPAWRLPCGDSLAWQTPCRGDQPRASGTPLHREPRHFPAFRPCRNHGARQSLTLAKLKPSERLRRAPADARSGLARLPA